MNKKVQSMLSKFYKNSEQTPQQTIFLLPVYSVQYFYFEKYFDKIEIREENTPSCSNKTWKSTLYVSKLYVVTTHFYVYKKY